MRYCVLCTGIVKCKVCCILVILSVQYNLYFRCGEYIVYSVYCTVYYYQIYCYQVWIMYIELYIMCRECTVYCVLCTGNLQYNVFQVRRVYSVLGKESVHFTVFQVRRVLPVREWRCTVLKLPVSSRSFIHPSIHPAIQPSSHLSIDSSIHPSILLNIYEKIIWSPLKQ